MTYYISDKGLELETENMAKAIGKIEAKMKKNRAKIIYETNSKLKELKHKGIILA